MFAARLMRTGDIRLIEVPVPVPGPGEVLVRVLAAGICGTDRHLFLGEYPCTPPVTLGHEFTGIVTALGDGADPDLLGRSVTCDPNIACGRCPPCLAGRVNLCTALQAVGVHRDGGFAEFAAFPAHRALVLPDGLDPRHGAFCEPLACCLHGIDIGGPKPGERAIILGGGGIGLLTLQLARAAGAETLLVTRQAAKRDLALSLGATAAAATPQAALESWPGGAELVMECAGVAETVTAAPRLTRRGGRAVLLGVLPAGTTVAIEPLDLLLREVALHSAFLNPFTQARAVALIGAGRIKVDALISRCIPLAELPDALRAPARPGEVKVLVLPGGSHEAGPPAIPE
jgi:L-iditol 2-dehydrogenase